MCEHVCVQLCVQVWFHVYECSERGNGFETRVSLSSIQTRLTNESALPLRVAECAVHYSCAAASYVSVRIVVFILWRPNSCEFIAVDAHWQNSFVVSTDTLIRATNSCVQHYSRLIRDEAFVEPVRISCVNVFVQTNSPEWCHLC